MEYVFDINLSETAIILFAVALFLLLPVVWLCLFPAWRINKAVKTASAETEPPYSAPSVSVIVYAGDNVDSLRHVLPAILGQRYPGKFEVIVVNDGKSDQTEQIVERLRIIHDNLYHTYTPEDARQLSRKKLALMIGMKAARHPITVHTTAAAQIDSENWLARMTQPFYEPSVEVVLGHSYIDMSNDKKSGKRSRIFNDALNSATWLAAALAKRPYRGTELNLAYTRDAFFRNRGFSRTLNYKFGDDDIFIHEIANRRNTAVVLHPETMVRRQSENPVEEYRDLQQRYYFTGSKIPLSARRKLAFGIFLTWCILGLCTAGAVMTWPNLFGLGIAVAIVLVTLIWISLVWRKTIRLLTGKRLLLTLPWLMLSRPFANMVAETKSRMYQKYNRV